MKKEDVALVRQVAEEIGNSGELSRGRCDEICGDRWGVVCDYLSKQEIITAYEKVVHLLSDPYSMLHNGTLEAMYESLEKEEAEMALRKREVAANEDAAASAKKSARYARIANAIALVALLLSLFSIGRQCTAEEPETQTQIQEQPKEGSELTDNDPKAGQLSPQRAECRDTNALSGGLEQR